MLVFKPLDEAALAKVPDAAKAEVKPGTKIFLSAAEKKPDGTLQTARITYGKDGLTPPM